MNVYSLVMIWIGLATAADDCFYTVVDLSYRLGPATNYYPNFAPFEMTPESLSLMISADRYMAGDEGGTKIEVPGRFCDLGYKVGHLSFNELFLLPASVIDLASKASMNDNYQATVQDVEEWQAVFGPFPPRSIVIFDFGWSARYPDEGRFFGRRGTIGTQLNHPGICPELADYLGRHVHVHAVGTDAPDLDCGRNNELTTSPSQRVLALHGKYTVTQLQLRRRRLPPVGAVVTVAPFYIGDGTAAPARVIAELCSDPVPEVKCPEPPQKIVHIEVKQEEKHVYESPKFVSQPKHTKKFEKMF